MSQERSWTTITTLSHNSEVSANSSTGSCEAEKLIGEPIYQEIRSLGSGFFGEVILATEREDPSKKVAIKLLPRGKGWMVKLMQRELLTHNSLCHPHIVHLKRVVLFETHLGIVLEYMPGGSLHEYRREHGAVPENRVKSYMKQLFMALHYMHHDEKQVVNRDIKLENLLLDEGHGTVKLADFGLAKGPLDSAPNSDVGTLCYQAPEVKAGTTYDGKLADIWSCGVCLFVLLFNSYPFVEPSHRYSFDADKIVQRAREGKYEIPDRPRISNESKDLISKCLQPSPQCRAPLAAVLEHPWFSSGLSSKAQKMTERCLLSGHTPISEEEMKSFAEEACRELHH